VGDAPVFVVGAPRSGTTLMRLVLNRHPRIAIPDETAFFPLAYEPLRLDPRRWPAIVGSYLDRCESRFRPTLDLGPVRATLGALASPDPALLLSLPLAAWAAAQGKPRWGEKTPWHILYADAIADLAPDAVIVALQRDPRAAVASMQAFRGIAARDVALLSRQWLDIWTKGRRVLEASIPADRRLVVHYETLVAEPERAVREVCGFLGECFDEAMLRFHETTADAAGPAAAPRLHGPIGSRPSDWRARLSPGEAAVVEAVCGATMEEFGYARQSRALRPDERLLLSTKMAYVDHKQRQHRQQRYHHVLYKPFGSLRRRRSLTLPGR
jgi:hypothetical protein